MAAEVAYYPYIYAKLDKKHYTRVTSHTRAAMFAGKVVGCLSGQLLVYYNLMDYRDLNYITLAGMNDTTLENVVSGGSKNLSVISPLFFQLRL